MEDCILQLHKDAFLASYIPSSRAVSEYDIAMESALNASVRRNPTYSPHLTSQDKSRIRLFWYQEISRRAEKYLQDNQDIDTYVRDVIGMKEAINDQFAVYLHNRISEGVRVSHCQKSLSIFLKYRWCQGASNVCPPACPIDRRVLQLCGRFKAVWTKLDDEDDFRRILRSIEKSRANNPCCSSIAEWELCAFNLSNVH